MNDIVKDSPVFENLWTAAQDVPFQPDWKNGTGYMDNAEDAAKAAMRLVRFTDEWGRRFIMMGGSLVGFRYTDSSLLIGHLFNRGRRDGDAYCAAEALENIAEAYSLQVVQDLPC